MNENLDFDSLDEFKERNKKLFSEPIVKSFFEENPTHLTLLEASVVHKVEEATEKLDKLFTEHFFLYKLMKYISTLSYNFSIEFDRRRKKQKTRFPLLIDHSYENENNNISVLSDHLLEDRNNSIDNSFEDRNRHSIYPLIEDKSLYQALKKLTPKEKSIIELIIIKEMKQIEISQVLNESPQNIAKTKKRALKKLRSDLIEYNYK
ncbi:sigma-70 family RNA polymerase sigma factor [Priestia endophytica]